MTRVYILPNMLNVKNYIDLFTVFTLRIGTDRLDPDEMLQNCSI